MTKLVLPCSSFSNALLDDALGARIDARSRLVQDQDAWACQRSTRN